MKEYKLMKKQEKICECLQECVKAKLECELVTTDKYTRDCYAEEVNELRRMLSNLQCGKWKIVEAEEKKNTLKDEQIKTIASLIVGSEGEIKEHGFCALCSNFDFLAGECCHPNGSCIDGVTELLKAGVK